MAYALIALLVAIMIALVCQSRVIALVLQMMYSAAYHFECYQIAVPVYSVLLGWLAKLTGEESYLLATSCDGLAVLLDAQGRYGESEAIYKRSLTIYRRLLHKTKSVEDNLDIVQSMTHTAEGYASLLQITGREEEAGYMIMQAIQLVSDLGLKEMAAKLKSHYFKDS